MELKKTVIEQMAWYAKHIEDEGIHYGNKDQFYKRHNEILKFIAVLYEQHRKG
jgi:hypothetical protein